MHIACLGVMCSMVKGVEIDFYLSPKINLKIFVVLLFTVSTAYITANYFLVTKHKHICLYSSMAGDEDEGKCCTEDRKYLTGIVLSIACLLLEGISMGCAAAYRSSYNESKEDLPGATIFLLGYSLFGQVIGCFIAGYLCSVAVKCCCSCELTEGIGVYLIIGIALFSVPALGPFQFISGILMMLSTADNEAANVQAFGAFITIINFVTAILAVVYAYFVFVPCCYAIHDNNNNAV